MAFPFVQLLYWLGLSTWFGGVLFVLAAAPIIHRTVRESNPILPTVLSVNLEGQHGTLLAGSIVANLLDMLLKVERVCAAVMFLAIAAQWALLDPRRYWLPQGVRTALYLAATGLVLYDWRRIWPQIVRFRQEYIDHADEPDLANAAKERFDYYHRESVTILMVLLGLLLAIVLLSAGMGPPGATVFAK